MREHVERGLAGGLVVEISVTGRVNGSLSTKSRGIGIGDRAMADMLVGQRHVLKFRQMCALVDTGNPLENTTGQAVLLIGSPIGNAGKCSGQLGVAIDFGQLPVDQTGLALAIFDRPVSQHQMGEVEIKFMRRDIGAFDHEAHVTKRTGIDDILDIASTQIFDFFVRALVNQVE